MNLQHFRIETDADGIALVTWGSPAVKMNLITVAVMDEMEQWIAALAADAAVKGVVVTSGKESFSGGADLSMLEGAAHELKRLARDEGPEAAMRGFLDQTRRLSQIYRRLETCGKPVAAAINGTCLGGAFELALACHYRVVADDDRARVGLPEIKVGLIPGAGGTQRVARLMQTGDALQMLFKGDQIRPRAAKGMGLVHEIAPMGEIVAAARRWVLAGGKALAPWDDKAFKAPRVFSATGMMVWSAANGIYRRETADNYPAARAILKAVYDGLQLPFDLALQAESRQFAHVLRTPEAAAMIRTLFVSMGELNKGARRPAAAPKTNLRRIGIIGAGFMGAGIGYVAAQAGLDVVLIDRDQASADKGRDHAQKLISDQVAKGRAKGADRDALMARIVASDDYGKLAGCDLVIEAVFEDRAVKNEALAKARAAIGPDAILASNTSTLPITSLAEAQGDPARFIGIHFFSPVEKMMLVEVIMGRDTGDMALASALDFVRTIKKTPIVVNDSRGFFANRCVQNYVREGHLMLMEGVPAAMIENVARMAGMPVGPLSLNDEVALDLGWKILQATKKDLGAAAVDPSQEKLLEFMVVQHQRLGRKNGKGFYDYEGRDKKLWPGLKDIVPKRLDPDALDVTQLQQRLLVTQALEAARTLHEGVVTDPREADVGSVLGFGFAPFTGGVISYIDGMGLPAFVALCDRLAKACGPRFVPDPFLRAMAEKGETFYRSAGARPAAA